MPYSPYPKLYSVELFFFFSGIGSFTIVDGQKVTGEDVGNKYVHSNKVEHNLVTHNIMMHSVNFLQQFSLSYM